MFSDSIYLFILFAAIYVTNCAPVSDDANAEIREYKNQNDGSGNYEFSYETSNGITRHEIGELVNAGQPDAHIRVRGEYSYLDAEGNLQTTSYTADENGYQVVPQTPILLEPEIVFALPPAVTATLLG